MPKSAEICLLSNYMQQAEVFLTRVEAKCAKVGLKLNAKKTEVMTYNILSDQSALTTTGGTALKEMNDFLGTWVHG